MNKRFAKIISLMLVLVMVLGVVPGSVFAGPQYNDGTNGFGDLIRNWWEIIVRPLPWYKPTPNYPAQSFGGDDLGGLVVNVEAPAGALPEGTEMYVERVYNTTNIQTAVDNSDLINGDVIAAVDITFYHNGAEFQPGSDVKVTLSYAGFDGCDDLSVVHIGASAEEVVNEVPFVDPVDDVESDGETVSFDARDFSVYAVVADDTVADVARLKVQFFGEDTVNPIAVVYINRLQSAPAMIEKIIDVEPEVVTNSLTVNDLVFCGWIPYKRNYTVSDFIDGNHSIDNVRAAVANRLEREVAEGDVLNVYAMLFYEYSVKYVGEEKDGRNPVIEAVTLYSKDGSPVDYQIDLSYTPESLATSKFNGWVIAPDFSTKYQYGDTITVDGDTILMTDVSNGHWIYFNEKPTDEYKGAKYVAPKFFETTESMDGYVAPESSLTGYHFDGWYTDANYTTEFNFTGKLTENKTLYAKWTMNSTADYTVIIWQQDVDDSADQSLTIAEKKYDYVCTVTVNNESTSSTINRNLFNTYTNYDGRSNVTIGKDTYDFYGFHYEGFTYSADKSGKVHPSGTTVVNVYYDRNYHTVKFQAANGTSYSTVSSPSTAAINAGEYFIKLGGKYYQVVSTTKYSNDSNTYVRAAVDWSLANNNTSYEWFYVKIDGTYYNIRYKSSYGWRIYYNSEYYSSPAVTSDLQVYWESEDAYSYYTYYTPTYTTIHTVGALYGQDITDIWNFTGSNNVTYPQSEPVTSWKPIGSSTYTARITKQVVMPDEDMTYQYRGTDQTRRYFYYYVEALEGDTDTVTYNGTEYVAKDSLVNDFNIVFYEDDFWNLRGFTRQVIADSNGTSVTISTSTSGSSWDSDGTNPITLSSGATANTLYFYYTRNQYKIHYMWGAFVDGNGNKLTAEKVGEIKSIDGIYFETNIDSYKVGGTNYFDPTRTLNNPAYVFEGWYKDPDCTVAFDFADMTMPANDIAVFAKFRTIQYRVFLRNVGESGTETYTVTFNDPNQSQNFRINYGEYISGGSPIEATRSDGMILAGWYLDSELTEPFDFYQEINNTNTVVYDKGDPFNYTDPADGTTSPLAINKDVDRTWIKRKLDLYAKWVAPLPNVDGINVVYDANMNDTITGTRQKDATHAGGRYYTDPCLYSDGVTAFVRSASTADNPDSTFDYWELLDKNGNVIGTYKPGQKFEINADTMARLTNPAAGSKGAGSEAQRDSGTRSGSPLIAPTETISYYKKVTTPEIGKSYLLATTYSGTIYVVTNTYYDTTNNYKPYVVPVSAEAISSGSGYYLTLGSTAYGSDLSSFMFTTGGSTSALTLKNSANKYLVFNNGGYPYYNSSTGSYGTWTWTTSNVKNRNWSDDEYYYLGIDNSGSSYFMTAVKSSGAEPFYLYEYVTENVTTLNEALNVSGGTLEFTNDTTYPWTVVTEGNRIYAQSGNAGVSDSSSDVKLTLTMAAGDTLSFDYYVSSESGYDYFRFLVNNNQVGQASGTTNTSWRTYTFTADAAGTYTFTWRYIKDSYTNSGNDCARVDNVTYTATAPAATYQVSFLDKDGNVISGSTQTVTEGSKPTAPADPAAPNGKRFDGWTRQGGGETVFPSNDLPEITADTVFVAHFSNLPIVGWYFETNPATDGWTFVDSDGDTHNWIWQADYSNTPYCTAYEGEGLIYSESYYKAGSTALTPDNWAITPAVTLPTGYASVTLYAKGQDARYPAEHFAIYVGTSANTANMTKISDEFVATGEYLKYEVDLNDYIGQTVYIAIRHYNVTDQFYLNVDQVEVWGEDAETPVTGGPYKVIFWDGYANEQIGELQWVNHGEAATAPEIPVHEGYTFIGWSTTFNSVTSDLRVVANYRDNSANVELNTMTVLMRAHYTTKQYTFITWHANNGTGNTVDSQRVLINENIDIEYPNTDSGNREDTIVSWPALEWEGHVFLGWARLEIGNDTTGIEAQYDPSKPDYVKQRDLDEEDLFLKYVSKDTGETHGKFLAKDKDGNWVDVKYVAADELMPYHGMYAVWADVFYVYHSGTNKVEQIVRTKKDGNFNLANRTSEGFLYGGYYKDYTGKSTNFDSKNIEWADVNVKWTNGELTKDATWTQSMDDEGAGKKAYNGSNAQWDGSKAYKAEDQEGNGLSMKPEAGAIYYIKEVPADKYLRPYMHYTYYTTGNNPIATAWLISDIDDLNYNVTGFVITDVNHNSTVVRSLTVTTATNNASETLTAMRIFGTRGYLHYLTVINDGRVGDPIHLLNTGNSVAQFWVTPDGCIVTGTAVRSYDNLSEANSIAGGMHQDEGSSTIAVYNPGN